MQSNNPLYDLMRTVVGPVAGSATSGVTSILERSAAGDTASSALSEALNRNAAQLTQLQSLFQTQTSATAENTQAVNANTTTVSQSGGASTAANIAKTVASTVTGGFALNPIVAGLMKIFGGSDQPPTPAPLEKFTLPTAVNLNAGMSTTASGLLPLSYGQNGLPRASAAAPSVTVQVNAMDSRSFMDRSEDIANAVRRAMLESSSLNDVVSEL